MNQWRLLLLVIGNASDPEELDPEAFPEDAPRSQLALSSFGSSIVDAMPWIVKPSRVGSVVTSLLRRPGLIGIRVNVLEDIV